MIKIDNETKEISLTRGDAPLGNINKIIIDFPIGDELYEFQLEDKITFSVFEKKGYTRREIFKIDYTLSDIGYSEPTTTIEIPLTQELTKKFESSNKKKTYWYDIVLNDKITIVGFDEEGAKKIIVYPGGVDV